MTTTEISILSPSKSIGVSTGPLLLNPYIPNLGDPKIKRRVSAVLEWCGSLLNDKRPRPIHNSVLTKVFANHQRNPGRWLYSNLLQQVANYAVGKRSYSYVLNVDGYLKLHKLVGLEVRGAAEVAKEMYADIVSGVKPLDYVDRGDRRYHAVQNLKRHVRSEVFAGWWDYDIEACAPTLLYQYVCHEKDAEWGAKWLPTIRRLVHEKDEVRQYVGVLTGLDEKQTKRLLNALVFKAVLAPHSACSTFQILRQDVELLYRVKSDPYIRALRREVRHLWELVATRHLVEQNRRLLWEGRTAAALKSTASLRMAIYRKLERQVIDAIEVALPDARLGCVLMHDGFMLKERVSSAVLEHEVLKQTGFAVKIKEAFIGKCVIDDEPDPLGDISDGELNCEA
jgi:hypothetical protein